jgi:hypothetical protein
MSFVAPMRDTHGPLSPVVRSQRRKDPPIPPGVELEIGQ